MLSLIKQVVIISLNFNSSLAHDRTEYVLLNDEPCMFRPTLIYLNPVELKYYPFMINLDKCSRSCNSANNLSIKMCVLNKTKDINV